MDDPRTYIFAGNVEAGRLYAANHGIKYPLVVSFTQRKFRGRIMRRGDTFIWHGPSMHGVDEDTMRMMLYAIVGQCMPPFSEWGISFWQWMQELQIIEDAESAPQ